jgi:hypothetical protein
MKMPVQNEMYSLGGSLDLKIEKWRKDLVGGSHTQAGKKYLYCNKKWFMGFLHAYVNKESTLHVPVTLILSEWSM